MLLCIVAGVLAFVVQSGELGSSDTMHRLQATHSFWTSEPPVFPQEYPEFGVHGRGGRLYGWFGMGQSLLMLPADMIGTALEKLPIFDEYNGNDPSVKNIFVSFMTSILVNILTALICFRFLRQLAFTTNQAVVGILALLFCTTHLHYTQNMMENNYIMLLTFTGFSFQYEWWRMGSKRALVIGSAALGLNLLTRLTTGLDLIAGGLFIFFLAVFEDSDQIVKRFFVYAKVAGPIYAFFLLIDRMYQYYRFGSFFNTYVSVVAKEYHQLDPTLPSNYPWETPFHVGFFGALLKPEKSIFLFDPLLILTILVVIGGWKLFRSEVKAYVIAVTFLLLAYISFYARYTVWSGDFAWGDRYVSTSVQFLAFISLPLLVRYRQQLGKLLWRAGVGLTAAVSLLVQAASLAFWLPLEIYQMETLGHPTFVIWLRFKNIVAFALGKMDQWGLTNSVMQQDPWDYVHITTWNFLPFLLRRVGEAPPWVDNIVLIVWALALAALIIGLWRLYASMRYQCSTGSETSSYGYN